MTNKELGIIENELINILNFHKAEKCSAEAFLRTEGPSDHLKYINAYEDGSINALKDAINVIRGFYATKY